uniref:Hemopexin n=1 Tax=Sphaeramia orbicularis TaxID=375764 RepID=A0A673BQ74_9TELE
FTCRGKWYVLCLQLTDLHISHLYIHKSSTMSHVFYGALPDRCQGIEFDAIALDEKGNALFFKDEYLWNGYHGPAQLSNESFKELDDIHGIGHVDAAFRMHNIDNPDDHDHIYFFLDDKVFSYYNQSLEDGYPKDIQQDFPQVPSHLDAAVECPKGECVTDSVLFFKGMFKRSFKRGIKDKNWMKVKTWPNLPVCTSVLRWLEHYYCFHGHNFTRFHPITGEVNGPYPKDARHYFMRCADFGGYQTPKCSDVKIDAITSDDAGKTYFFAGTTSSSTSSQKTFTILGWKEVTNGVDAVFSYTGKLYMIKDDQVYIYKGDAHYSLIEGYPKTLREELGIEGHVDAAFVCPSEHTVHVIQGQNIRNIDLIATPRVVTQDVPLMLSGIDAAMCGSDGIKMYKGSQFYHYENMVTLTSRIAQMPQNITGSMFGCRD